MKWYQKFLMTVLLLFMAAYTDAQDQDFTLCSEDQRVMLYKYAALLPVLKKQCCGSTTVYPQCIPGSQSCISQAIRAKYCFI
jgi:hypothetical protein